jgi:hypothetical protein
MSGFRAGYTRFPIGLGDIWYGTSRQATLTAVLADASEQRRVIRDAALRHRHVGMLLSISTAVRCSRSATSPVVPLDGYPEAGGDAVIMLRMAAAT